MEPSNIREKYSDEYWVDETDEELLLDDVDDIVYSCIYDIAWLLEDNIKQLAKLGVPFKEIKETIDDSFKEATLDVYKVVDVWKKEYFKEDEE